MKRPMLALALLAGTSVAAQGPDARAAALRVARTAASALEASLAPGSALRATGTLVEDSGDAHVRLQQYYRGIPVFEGEAIVHVDLVAQAVRGTTDALQPFAPIGIQPAITRGLARGRAMGRAGLAPEVARGLAWREDLLILADQGTASLVWRLRGTGDAAIGPIDTVTLVDAVAGDVRRTWNNVQTAAGTGQGFLNGIVPLETAPYWAGFVLRDASRGNQRTLDMRSRYFTFPLIFADLDNAWGDGTLADPQSVAVDAQYGAERTWDYYLAVHGRHGVADDGRGARSRVHYGVRYSNAFWSDACFCMTYGDGNGTTVNPLVALDVAGHEMTHGVTSRTANLTYLGEAGGLNEATSDIFGTMVEFFANNPNDTPDYEIGERIFVGGGWLRSMVRPSDDGASADCWYPGVGLLDVHYSSGVGNHFFYLLAEGTANGLPSPTCQPGDARVATGRATVMGIGPAAAERIWYRALSVYMTAGTNYAGARTATLAAATDLYGFASAEAQAVAAAWDAVGRP